MHVRNAAQDMAVLQAEETASLGMVQMLAWRWCYGAADAALSASTEWIAIIARGPAARGYVREVV